MHSLYKGALVLGVASTGSVGVFYGTKALTTIKIKDKLKNRLLSTKGEENKSQGEDRLASLRKDTIKNETLTSELQEIKDTKKNKSGENLRDLCSARVEETYTEEDLKFKEIVDYCTFRNKDKLGSKVITEELEANSQLKSNGKWTKVSNLLKDKTGTFSSTIKAIQDKLKANQNPDTLALKKWCEENYETPGTDNEDANFKDAQEYCLDQNGI